MNVPVLRLGGILIASVQDELSDEGWADLSFRMLQQVGTGGAHGAVIDLTGLDMVDSYAGRVLFNTARALELRGARAVVAGLQPDVAYAIVQLGMDMKGLETALDLEDAVLRLGLRLEPGRAHGD